MKSLREKKSNSLLGNEQHIALKEACQLVNQYNIHYLNFRNFLFPSGSWEMPSLSSGSKRIVIFLCVFFNILVVSKEQLQDSFPSAQTFSTGHHPHRGPDKHWLERAALGIVGHVAAPRPLPSSPLSCDNQKMSPDFTKCPLLVKSISSWEPLL